MNYFIEYQFLIGLVSGLVLLFSIFKWKQIEGSGHLNDVLTGFGGGSFWTIIKNFFRAIFWGLMVLLSGCILFYTFFLEKFT